MNVAQAIAAGYTREVTASYLNIELRVLVKPDVEFDERFAAFDIDEQEMIWINGHIGTFEDVEPHETQSVFLATTARYLEVIEPVKAQGTVCSLCTHKRDHLCSKSLFLAPSPVLFASGKRMPTPNNGIHSTEPKRKP